MTHRRSRSRAETLAIVGAGPGLGSALARRFAKAGARPAGHAHNLIYEVDRGSYVAAW